MNTILYTKTGVLIYPYKVSKLQPIVKMRSIWDPVRHRYLPVTAYPIKDDIDKALATYYISPAYIKTLLPDYEIIEMEPNQVIGIDEDFRLNDDVVPSEIQAASIQTIIDQKFHQAFFNIPTGVGKTLMSVYLTSILKMKSLIMCYNTEVLRQWYLTIEEMTTFDIRRAVILTRSKDILAMVDGSYPTDMYDIYMCTPGLLTRFAEKNGLLILNDALNHIGIGVKFFDEAHRNIANITKINALTNIDRTYYLSADFKQANHQHQKLYYHMFQSVPIIRPNDNIIETMKHTNAVVVHYNTEPSLIDQESVYTRYGFNHHHYMEYQMSCDEFYQTIEKVLKSIIDTNNGHHRVLLLANMIEHVDVIAHKVEIMIKDTQYKVGRFHSRIDKNIKDDVLKNCDIIVSTYQSMGVGVDVKGIRYVVSLSTVNPIEDNQAAGRARALQTGEDCFYFIFCDDGFDYNLKKLPIRLAYLKKQKLKKIFSIKY